MDKKNDLRHDVRTKYQIGLKSARGTTWLPIGVFDFFIACTEMNKYIATKHFLNNDENFMSFRKSRLMILLIVTILTRRHGES